MVSEYAMGVVFLFLDAVVEVVGRACGAKALLGRQWRGGAISKGSRRLWKGLEGVSRRLSLRSSVSKSDAANARPGIGLLENLRLPKSA
jgi:hypothetical protein